ncbi:MAG: PAS domain S-box protein [Methanomicrobiales archaeon]|nr:PAS domain S-box protein [Methanomicrobiales archaeon]
MTPTRTPGTIWEAPPEYRILDDLDDCYLLVSENGKVTWANQAFRHIFGMPKGDLEEAVHALGRGGNIVTRILAVPGDGDDLPAFECRVRDLEGGERLCLCSGRKTSSGRGWLLRFQVAPGVGGCEEIIEYTGAATILIEDDSTISAANTEFERLSRYSRKEIVGVKHLTDFIAYDDEHRRLMGYHALRRRDPAAAPKNYSFSFIDRSGKICIVEVTIGMIPVVNQSMMSLIDVTARRRAEEALQKSEERLNLAFTAANDGLVDWDISTGAIFCSPRCFTMLGYEPGAFVPSISALFSNTHPDDRSHLEEGLSSMATGERDRLNIEFRARSASGRWIYLLGRLQVVRRDADGAPLRITGTYSDITERKEAERELLIRDMAMESSLSAIGIADLDGYLTYANQALVDMRGLIDPHEIRGHHISDLWADPEKIREVLRTLAERGRYTGELTGRRSDGTEFTAHVTANFVTGQSGEPVCIMATAVDITEKRHMEKALRESEVRYRTLAESTPDIIFLISRDGDVLYLNSIGGCPFGMDPEILRGRNVREFYPPDVVKEWLETIRRAADSTSGPVTRETLLPGEGGGTWLETRFIPIVGSEGSTGTVLGISRDITMRKRTEEQLRFQALVLGQVDNAVIAIDMEKRITYMNRAAERLYGVSSREAPGKLIMELFTCEWLHPGDKEEFWRTLRDPGIWRGVTAHQKICGETIFVDATISALKDEHGEAAGMLCSFRDVTEQRSARHELQIKDMALESSLSGIVLADLNGRIIYTNRAFLAMSGWDQEEDIIGKPVSVLWVNPEAEKRFREETLRGGAWFGEIMSRRRDGTIVPIQLAISIVTDRSGRTLCLMGSGIDMSQQKETEREIRVRDMAMASSLNAFTVADLDGRLTYVNQAFLSIWGYTSETEVLGRLITEFWQDEEDARDALQVLLDSGRYVAERIGKRRDGTVFYAMYSGNMVTDDAGTPICLTASIADITDLKQAKADIQARNRELSILNQIIGVSVSATDIDEALEGVLAAIVDLLDLSGGGIYLVAPDRQSAQLVCARGLPKDFSWRAYIPDITAPPYVDIFTDGSAVFVNGSGRGGLPPYAAIPIVAPGVIIGSLNLMPHDHKEFTDADRPLLVAIGKGIGSSIERTLLIQQLEKAQREANLYLDILSHDIRNAENISGLYIDLLIDTLDGEAKGYAQKVRSSIRKSVEILRNVSTIRRIHHESAMLGPIDLDGIIQEEIGVFSEIIFHYDESDLVVMADLLLTEAFTNLIGNAVKFGGPAVEITIRVEESGDDVLVSVEDTGPGIPDEMKEAVFMRFGKNMNQKSGQGLGLYITRMLIKRYGGRIWVDDRVPGHPECGAAFRFTLRRA